MTAAVAGHIACRAARTTMGKVLPAKLKVEAIPAMVAVFIAHAAVDVRVTHVDVARDRR